MKTTAKHMIGLFICMTVLLSNTDSSYGQTNINDTSILRQAFRHVTTKKQIVYVDTVNTKNFVTSDLCKIIRKGKISGINKTTKANSIKLTKIEREYILNQLAQQAVWTDRLFSNSLRIDNDSLWAFLQQEKSNRMNAFNIALMQNDTITLNRLKNDLTFVFSFQRPIYFRNNTFCLISFSAMCGIDCGQTETSFYKKENDIWTKWIVVSAGDY